MGTEYNAKSQSLIVTINGDVITKNQKLEEKKNGTVTGKCTIALMLPRFIKSVPPTSTIERKSLQRSNGD